MKLDLFKNIWLAISLSAFFISCNKKDDVIGLNLQEEEGVFSHYLLEDELNWKVYGKIEDDSLLTSGVDYIHVGAFNDEYAGKVSSKSYLQIGLAGDNPNFINAVVDSVVFRLAFNSNSTASRILQGDKNGLNKLSIYKMTEGFVDSLSYNNNQNFAFETTSLGDIEYTPLQETSYLEFKIDLAFAQEMMDLANGKTKEEFKEVFFGIVLSSSTNDQAIVAFDINSSNSYIRAYYHDSEANREYYFDLGTTHRHLVSLESDRSSTIFSALNNSTLLATNTTNDLGLIQNGVGASLVFTFGDIASLIDTTQNFLINKAVIRLPIVESSYASQEKETVPLLRLYECDAFGNIIEENGAKKILVPDFNFVINGGSGYFGYNSSNKYYEIDLTYYFQEYILNKRQLNSILITPNMIANGINYQARTNRSIIDMSNVSFKIYYSDL